MCILLYVKLCAFHRSMVNWRGVLYVHSAICETYLV